jgi:hypothetical protein
VGAVNGSEAAAMIGVPVSLPAVSDSAISISSVSTAVFSGVAGSSAAGPQAVSQMKMNANKNAGGKKYFLIMSPV